MAESTKAGKGYRSPVNLGLPQIPQTGNQEDFQQYLLIYNAIHMLNAYLDDLRIVLEGGDSTQKPSETMRFLRSFWIEADTDIPKGSVISDFAGKAVLGAGFRASGSYSDSFLTGIALTDALAGEKVRFGVGPAMMEVPGFRAGGLVYAPLAGETSAGSMLAEEPDSAYDIDVAIIGKCVVDNFVMITSGFSY